MFFNLSGSKDTMKEIYEKLQEKKHEFGNLKDVLNAHVPILKFSHIKSGIKCDLSFSNRMALMNSKFLRKCLEIDTR